MICRQTQQHTVPVATICWMLLLFADPTLHLVHAAPRGQQMHVHDCSNKRTANSSRNLQGMGMNKETSEPTVGPFVTSAPTFAATLLPTFTDEDNDDREDDDDNESTPPPSNPPTPRPSTSRPTPRPTTGRPTARPSSIPTTEPPFSNAPTTIITLPPPPTTAMVTTLEPSIPTTLPPAPFEYTDDDAPTTSLWPTLQPTDVLTMVNMTTNAPTASLSIGATSDDTTVTRPLAETSSASCIVAVSLVTLMTAFATAMQ